jgi:hypothetical protein
MRRLAPVLFACLLASACGPTPTTQPAPTTEAKPTTPDPSPYAGCHPGCFPAGTLVRTPTGLREVWTLREGETVTLIDIDGRTTSGPVVAVFDTCNELVEVRTDGGTLTTTTKQPLCLKSGECKPAGELTTGEVIWRWVGGERNAVQVKEVVPTGRHAAVYNLVVGEGKVFVANGFLAKGKPPADR